MNALLVFVVVALVVEAAGLPHVRTPGPWTVDDVAILLKATLPDVPALVADLLPLPRFLPQSWSSSTAAVLSDRLGDSAAVAWKSKVSLVCDSLAENGIQARCLGADALAVPCCQQKPLAVPTGRLAQAYVAKAARAMTLAHMARLVHHAALPTGWLAVGTHAVRLSTGRALVDRFFSTWNDGGPIPRDGQAHVIMDEVIRAFEAQDLDQQSNRVLISHAPCPWNESAALFRLRVPLSRPRVLKAVHVVDVGGKANWTHSLGDKVTVLSPDSMLPARNLSTERWMAVGSCQDLTRLPNPSADDLFVQTDSVDCAAEGLGGAVLHVSNSVAIARKLEIMAGWKNGRLALPPRVVNITSGTHFRLLSVGSIPVRDTTLTSHILVVFEHSVVEGASFLSRALHALCPFAFSASRGTTFTLSSSVTGGRTVDLSNDSNPSESLAVLVETAWNFSHQRACSALDETKFAILCAMVEPYELPPLPHSGSDAVRDAFHALDSAIVRQVRRVPCSFYPNPKTGLPDLPGPGESCTVLMTGTDNVDTIVKANGFSHGYCANFAVRPEPNLPQTYPSFLRRHVEHELFAVASNLYHLLPDGWENMFSKYFVSRCMLPTRVTALLESGSWTTFGLSSSSVGPASTRSIAIELERVFRAMDKEFETLKDVLPEGTVSVSVSAENHFGLVHNLLNLRPVYLASPRDNRKGLIPFASVVRAPRGLLQFLYDGMLRGSIPMVDLDLWLDAIAYSGRTELTPPAQTHGDSAQSLRLGNTTVVALEMHSSQRFAMIPVVFLNPAAQLSRDAIKESIGLMWYRNRRAVEAIGHRLPPVPMGIACTTQDMDVSDLSRSWDLPVHKVSPLDPSSSCLQAASSAFNVVWKGFDGFRFILLMNGDFFNMHDELSSLPKFDPQLANVIDENNVLASKQMVKDAVEIAARGGLIDAVVFCRTICTYDPLQAVAAAGYGSTTVVPHFEKEIQVQPDDHIVRMLPRALVDDVFTIDRVVLSRDWEVCDPCPSLGLNVPMVNVRSGLVALRRLPFDLGSGERRLRISVRHYGMELKELTITPCAGSVAAVCQNGLLAANIVNALNGKHGCDGQSIDATHPIADIFRAVCL